MTWIQSRGRQPTKSGRTRADIGITDKFVLPEDVLLTPVDELPAAMRAAIDSVPGDVALTRPSARVNSRVIDSGAAALLERFRTPTSIVDAVIAFAAERDAEPEDVLKDAYVLVRRLLVEGLLFAEGSDAARAIEPTMRAGDKLAGWQIADCVQALDDTELYRVERAGQQAALKIQRHGGVSDGTLDREAVALGQLDGGIAPRLLGDDVVDGRRYLIMEWVDGEQLLHVAGRLRAGGRRSRRALANVVIALLDAYAALHETGLIHGDVHPRNLLVVPGPQVRLIDFGFAVEARTAADAPRAGVGFFFEPELATAYLARTSDSPPTYSGEQYSVAALAYLALVGAQTHRFSVESVEVLRQIVEDDPLAFSQHGVSGWPHVETALVTALAKDPESRYSSVADLASAVSNAVETDLSLVANAADESRLDMLVDDVLDVLGARDPLSAAFPGRGPTASITYGAAGVGYALLRIAQARNDAELLGAADLWSAWAMSEASTDQGFYNADIDVTSNRVDPSSIYHQLSGLHVVRALIAHAQGDLTGTRISAEAFAAASPPSEPINPDLTLGSSSTLIGGSLLQALPEAARIDRTGVAGHCDRVADELWLYLESQPPIGESTELTTLGIAHGWAGYLYAQMRWATATHRSVPAGIEARLDQLASLAEPFGEGLRWAWSLRQEPPSYMPGWCNGSAGYVFLWTLAHELLGGNRYMELAQRSAVNAWTEPSLVDNLCCGYAGRAFALLALYRATDEKVWLERAQELARDSAYAPGLQDDLSRNIGMTEHSLYKGRVGVAVLASELEHPSRSAMPLFEPEPWAVRAADPTSSGDSASDVSER